MNRASLGKYQEGIEWKVNITSTEGSIYQPLEIIRFNKQVNPLFEFNILIFCPWSMRKDSEIVVDDVLDISCMKCFLQLSKYLLWLSW